MHVEISVALNFLISYLYNKLPRRRVDLFGEELEKGLKKKFAGHWYPDKPFKGSGFRCVRCNGEHVDPVIVSAVLSAGLELVEVKHYIPEEMTLWIDPSEVSYRISEKSAIKVLYTDRPDDDDVCGSGSSRGSSESIMDREVQAANHHTFNPEALSFQPISHPLSSSLSSLSLSPSSPVPPGTWSTSVSPSSSLFSSPLPSSSSSSSASSCSASAFACSAASAAVAGGVVVPHQSGVAAASLQPVAPVFLGASTVSSTPKFTAASFAATKFGSTKLKSQAKRPTRLSPTHLGHYFRQHHQQQQQQQQQQQIQQGGMGCGGLGVGVSVGVGVGPATSPQRPRSLSPRDPRLEFLLDKQARSFVRGQLSPSSSSPCSSLAHSLQQQQQQHHQQQQHCPSTFPHDPTSSALSSLPFSLGMGEGLHHHHHHHHHLLPSSSSSSSSTSPHLSPNGQPAFPEMLVTPGGAGGMHSPPSSLSPDAPKSFVEGLQHLHGYPANTGYPGASALQHLLVAN